VTCITFSKALMSFGWGGGTILNFSSLTSFIGFLVRYTVFSYRIFIETLTVLRMGAPGIRFSMDSFSLPTSF
jgi:hypothetical protein